MPPVPKKKHTHARSAIRRGAKKLKLPNLVVCKNCKKLKIPHKACPYCGNYKD